MRPLASATADNRLPWNRQRARVEVSRPHCGSRELSAKPPRNTKSRSIAWMPRPLGIKPFVARATVESLREERRTGCARHWPSLGSWTHAYLVWHLRRNQRQKARSSWPLRFAGCPPWRQKNISAEIRAGPTSFFLDALWRQTVRPAKVGPPRSRLAECPATFPQRNSTTKTPSRTASDRPRG